MNAVSVFGGAAGTTFAPTPGQTTLQMSWSGSLASWPALGNPPRPSRHRWWVSSGPWQFASVLGGSMSFLKGRGEAPADAVVVVAVVVVAVVHVSKMTWRPCSVSHPRCQSQRGSDR